MSSCQERYKQFIKMLKNPKKGNNGGNPAAWLWFCGIENHPGKIVDKHNNKLLNNAGYVRMKNQDIQGFNSAILQILQELDFISDVKFADDMYTSDAPFYCANLFPFAIDRHAGLDLDDMIFRLTGLPTLECYEHIATHMRGVNKQWQKFSSAARVVVCFSLDVSNIYRCMDMFCRSGADWDEMEKQLLRAKENKEAVFCLKGADRTIIACPHPASHYANKKAHFSKVAHMINSMR